MHYASYEGPAFVDGPLFGLQCQTLSRRYPVVDLQTIALRPGQCLMLS